MKTFQRDNWAGPKDRVTETTSLKTFSEIQNLGALKKSRFPVKEEERPVVNVWFL